MRKFAVTTDEFTGQDSLEIEHRLFAIDTKHHFHPI